jgi:predicted TIM-barrel fold metal-dependent hydrolase
MIWDLHCHLSGVDGRTPDERIAQLMTYADRMGLERMVFFMGWPWSQDPTPDEFRRQNDQVVQALSHWHHRAFGLAYVNPKYPDESVKEIERLVRDGPMLGIKLWVAVRCNDERLDPIVSLTRELKGIVYQHTWLKAGDNLPGESTPQNLAELAARHPKASIICGHTGGDWERGIRAIRPHKNVTIDTGGSDPTAGFVEMAVRELGAERILYGSDIGGRSFATQIGKVTGADVPEAAKRMILGTNLRRLLEPILREKGVRP